METSELIAFLRARLDEDEQAARAATDGGPEWRTVVICQMGVTTHVPTRDHIARHDPARVLAEVEAGRQQIDLCEYLAGWTDKYDWQVTEHEVWAMRMAAQEMLRRLALPWSGHDDYRQEWRP